MMIVLPWRLSVAMNSYSRRVSGGESAEVG
jgi:hypothetical protein